MTKYLTGKYLKEGRRVVVRCEEVGVEMEIIRDKEEKVRLVD